MLDVMIAVEEPAYLSMVANAKGRGYLTAIDPDLGDGDCWEPSPNNMFPADWLGTGGFIEVSNLQVADDSLDTLALALAKAVTRLGGRVLVTATVKGETVSLFSSAGPDLEAQTEIMRVMNTPPPSPAISLKYQSKVKQVLDNRKGKPLKEFVGGAEQMIAFLADEAKRIDPELGQLPSEELTRLVTAWAFGGLTVLKVDQDGPRVIKRAKYAPGTEQLLRNLGINSEH